MSHHRNLIKNSCPQRCSILAFVLYSLIRRTIFAEKICLFDQNLPKTWGASYTEYFRATEYNFSQNVNKAELK